MSKPIKLVRITTVPLSMRLLLAGQPAYMRAKGLDVILVSSDGPDWEGIPDIGAYDVHKVNMARRISLFEDVRALWHLIRLFRRIRPDIVHSHTPKAGLLAMVASRLTGVKTRLHTVAGLPLMEASGPKRTVLNCAERITYACATRVYPNSNGLKNFIIQEKFTGPSKLKVIASGSSNGIDVEYFQPDGALREAGKNLRKEWGVRPEDVVFLFVGRIVKDKGINELVAAFAELSLKWPQALLVLVGGFEDTLDPVDPKTREMIAEHTRIRSTGFVHDVRPFFVASDVLVFPSYREGFPNVPMQAGCFDLPSVVTDINGCNEIIEDGVNGLVVPPKDHTALGVAMAQLIESPVLRRDLSARARSRILKNYRREVIWDAIFGEYCSLLRDDEM